MHSRLHIICLCASWGLHSDSHTTKGCTTYNRTSNHRTISMMVCTTSNYVCSGLISIESLTTAVKDISVDPLAGDNGQQSCILMHTNIYFCTQHTHLDHDLDVHETCNAATGWHLLISTYCTVHYSTVNTYIRQISFFGKFFLTRKWNTAPGCREALKDNRYVVYKLIFSQFMR